MKIEKLDFNKAVCVSEVVDKINEIIELLNKSSITQDADIFDNPTIATLNDLTDLDVVSQDDNLTSVKSVFDDIRCPYCNAKYFSIGPTYRTAVYYPPIIKDGVNINPDKNKSVTEYNCMNCGKTWREES